MSRVSRAAAGAVMAAALVLAREGTAVPEPERPVQQARAFLQRALEAHRSQDYAAYLENMQAAVRLSPRHPTYLYNLAGAYALTGDAGEALSVLARVARMGLIYPAAEDEDFKSLRETEGFRSILTRFASNKAPVGGGETAFTVHEKGLIAEGIAYDPVDKAFFIGSVRKRQVLRRAGNGKTAGFSRAGDGLWGVFGMKVDPRRRLLWVCSAALPEMEGYREEDAGRSGVFKYDLRTGKLIQTYLLPGGPEKHLLGDLAVGADGRVFITDSLAPVLYVIEPHADSLQAFLPDGPFGSLQGLDFTADGKHLIVADYSRGLFRVDLESREAELLESPDDVTLLGMDGLYAHRGGDWIGVQNGVNPNRIVRLHLDREGRRVARFEVIAAGGAVEEPTLGVLVGNDLAYIANSEWSAFDEKTRLLIPEKQRQPVIRKLRL